MHAPLIGDYVNPNWHVVAMI